VAKERNLVELLELEAIEGKLVSCLFEELQETKFLELETIGFKIEELLLEETELMRGHC